jgi:rSAM/selenodomain-associated transferase 1
MARVILLFLKFPEPGRVKTRLAAAMGAENAAKAYRCLVAEVCRQLAEEDDLLVLFDPPDRELDVAAWLRELMPSRRFALSPQVEGDLGSRLTHAFDAAFARGYKLATAIGSDCVELTPAHFAEAWRELDRADGVIGPTVDGGYYLLALKTPQPTLFREIDWSTGAVFEQTVERAASAGLRLHVLPALHDVDTVEDWQRAESQMRAANPGSEKNC